MIKHLLQFISVLLLSVALFPLAGFSDGKGRPVHLERRNVEKRVEENRSVERRVEENRATEKRRIEESRSFERRTAEIERSGRKDEFLKKNNEGFSDASTLRAKAEESIRNKQKDAKNEITIVDGPNGKIDISKTLDRIKKGEKDPLVTHRNDGKEYKNYTREDGTKLLPEREKGYYAEWVHPTEGMDGPGRQRVLTGKGGEIYYSPDHYETKAQRIK